MAEIHDTLRRLLEHPKFRKALIGAFQTGIGSSDKFHEIDLADHIRHARGVHTSNTPFEEVPEQIKEAIQSSVISYRQATGASGNYN
jgi:hypothetical protein